MRQLCRLGRVVLTDDRLDYLAERYIKIKKLLQDVSFESYLLHSQRYDLMIEELIKGDAQCSQ